MEAQKIHLELTTTNQGVIMKYINEFELVDHGVEHEQYFQGCGITFSKFNYAVTGMGNTLEEAIEDCIEQIALSGVSTDSLTTDILEQEGWESFPGVTDRLTICDRIPEVHHYASICWSELYPL